MPTTSVPRFNSRLTRSIGLFDQIQGTGAVHVVETEVRCRLPLSAAPKAAPILPAAESHGVLFAEIEGRIAAAGLESTIIRPGMFASNALFWWAPAIRARGVVRWPYGAAETAPVDDRDVAAVAARTLYQDGHAGGDYVLTGPESRAGEHHR
jgi:uncharacterized protein YbjT (DUF2867 family)